MRDSKIYPYLFAGIISVISGSLLLGAHSALESRIILNKQTEEYEMLFDLIGKSVKASPDKIAKLFLRTFKKQTLKNGKTRYAISEGGKITGYVYKFKGDGFWGTIEGYAYFDSDILFLKGITVTNQDETPGLGAEITSSEFLNKFKNKRITETLDSNKIKIKLVPFGKAGRDEIDGISGATETTKKFADILHNLFKSVIKDRNKAK